MMIRTSMLRDMRRNRTAFRLAAKRDGKKYRFDGRQVRSAQNMGTTGDAAAEQTGREDFSLSCKDDLFDTVCVSFGTETPDREEVLRELYRITAPGGYILWLEPGSWHWLLHPYERMLRAGFARMLLRQAGCTEILCKRRWYGTQVLLRGKKPDTTQNE